MSDPGGGVAPQWPAGNGPRVFAYLKGGHRGIAQVLHALAARGCRTIAYVPDVEAGRAAPVADPRIVYSDKPVDLGAAFATADACACHVGTGTTARALLAGVPLLLLPMQAEQKLNARAVERMGAGVVVKQSASADEIEQALARVLDERAIRDAARAFAARHDGLTLDQQTAALADAVEHGLA
jgi:UDP:flavonoid glycosyltransferase YjiC (YdhE family)